MASDGSGRGSWLWILAALVAMAVVIVAVGWGTDDAPPPAPVAEEPPEEPEQPAVLRPVVENQLIAPTPAAVEHAAQLDPPGALPSPSAPLGMIVSGTCREYESVACGCGREMLCARARARVRAWMAGGDYRDALALCGREIEVARAACDE